MAGESLCRAEKMKGMGRSGRIAHFRIMIALGKTDRHAPLQAEPRYACRGKGGPIVMIAIAGENVSLAREK